MTVMAAFAWPDNAHMINAVLDMLDVPVDAKILDPTYGSGNWWPADIGRDVTTGDILTGQDFTDMDYEDDTFDVVTFDPPYVCIGGRDTSTVKDFNNTYGLMAAPRTHPLLLDLIFAGLDECVRVCKPRGFVLVKCMPYVTSGKLEDTPFQIKAHALAQTVGKVELFDELIHLRRPGPQPAHDRQVHARRNQSNLLVFRKGRG